MQPRQAPQWLGRPDIHEQGGPTFPAKRVPTGAGDHYLGCTDGITEAGRPKTLGTGGLLDFLNAMPDRPAPQGLLDRVFALAAARDAAAWPGDDATAVAWRL